jgi:hydroxymethylglutaryl-CoA lyase
LSSSSNPAFVELTDVTLRDGLQMESTLFSVEAKFELLKHLAQCGYDRIEVTSFVNPEKVPQFADSEAFAKRIYSSKERLPPLMAFAPNKRGVERLTAYLFPWISCFVSVSETFNKKNVNASIDESLVQVEAIVEHCHAQKRKVRVYISTLFGCPYEGPIDMGVISRVIRTVASFEPDEIALGDTIGVATPHQVRRVLAFLEEFVPLEKVAMHFHHTYGLGVASALAAYECGVRKFDGATAGIGGCPYAKGASGNVPTEDLAYAFFRQGAFPGIAVNETHTVLRHLTQQMKLPVRSALGTIWEKGGTWYGV